MPDKKKSGTDADAAPTRDEFSALDAARAKLDTDVADLRSVLHTHAEDIGQLRTKTVTINGKLDAIILKLGQLSSASTVATASSVPSASSVLSRTPTASVIAANPSSIGTDTSPTSTVAPGWDSVRAAAAGGPLTTAQPQDMDRRARLNDTNDNAPQDSGRFFNIKPEELGMFDGVPEDTELFISDVEAIRASEPDGAWDKAVLRALPRTLRGPARLWFASLTATERSQALRSTEALLKLICDNFKPPPAVVRRQARDRHWQPEEEDLIYYSFVKAALLKTAWPSLKEEDLVNEVIEGIEPAIAKLLQVPHRDRPTLTALRNELRIQETYWRLEQRRPLVRGKDRPPSFGAGVPAYDQLLSSAAPAATSAAYPQQSNSFARPLTNGFQHNRRGASIRDDFDPTRLAYRIQLEQKKRMMAYPVPNPNRIMWCARPCRTCGGDHFDFAHDHCQSNVVPSLNNMEAEDEYPTTLDDGVELGGDSQEDF
ncbi:hypothetical protein OC834_007316 [Tilletia horrida]|nr:hypothetical protein OC834_007316 [Tilletia horrida]